MAVMVRCWVAVERRIPIWNKKYHRLWWKYLKNHVNCISYHIVACFFPLCAKPCHGEMFVSQPVKMSYFVCFSYPAIFPISFNQENLNISGFVVYPLRHFLG